MGCLCNKEFQEPEISTRPENQPRNIQYNNDQIQIEQEFYYANIDDQNQIKQTEYQGLKLEVDNLLDRFIEYKESINFEKQHLEVTIEEQQKQILVLQNQINDLEEQIKKIDDQY